MGIILSTNFDIGAGILLDSRNRKATITGRNNIPSIQRVTGLEVYVEETGIKYRLEGGITNTHWVDVSSHSTLQGLSSDDHLQYALLVGRSGDVLKIDEIKSYTSAIPLIKKSGSNVIVGTSITLDNVNTRVGIHTSNPLDHWHLTGNARISTLSGTKSSIVSANTDGRLIKIPYTNDYSQYLRSDGTWATILTSTGDFLDSVVAMQKDASTVPSLTLNARYIILDKSTIHTNFKGTYATIAAWIAGEGVNNGDIVSYNGTNFTQVFDSVGAMQPATVTVGLDKNGKTGHQWTFNATTNIWIDRGAATEHNSLNGLNDGDYKHLTATVFTALTGGDDIGSTYHSHSQYKTSDLRWDGGSTGLVPATGRASLGLGTAATKDVQTSSTASSGVMEVGAFGLGSNSLGVSITDDTRTYNRFGLVRFWDSGTNKPFTYGTILSIPSYDNYYTQIITNATETNSIGFRKNINGTYSNYFTFFHTGNLVNPVTGTGTSGYLPKFTGTSALGNSVIYETGGNVLIGTTMDSGAKLEVVGSITARFGNTPGGGVSNTILFDRLASNDSLNFNFREGTTTKAAIGLRGSTDGLSFTIGSMISANVAMYIDTNKNVAIGKTSVTSGYMLDVNGAIIATGGNSTNWNTAYTDRFKWDGGSTGLVPATGRASLGLGTAATKDVQTSSTASSGVMEVGAFGLGSNSLGVSITDDTRTYNRFGLVRFWDSGTNKPFTYGTILSIPSYNNYYTQIITSATDTNSIGFRKNINGTYSDYFTFYHTGNLVNPVTGTGTAGRVAFWNSTTGLTKHDDFLFDNGTLSFANGGGGRGVEISNSGIRFKVDGTSGWSMHLTAIDQSNSIIGNIVGGYGQANSISYAYLGGGTAYSNAALYAHSNGTVSINKIPVTSGYTLDVNGATAMTGLKIGTLSGLLKASSGVVGTATAGTGSQAPLTNPITGTGTANQIAYFTGTTSLASLSTTTYPSLTELSRVKGVTSEIQTQLNNKQATLVSGTNIKTIATNSILGSGSLINITISTTEPTGGTYYNGDIWVES